MFNFPQLVDELLGDDKEEFFEFLSIVLDDIRGMNIDRISHYRFRNCVNYKTEWDGREQMANMSNESLKVGMGVWGS